MNPEELKNVILNSSQPLIFKQAVKWEILKWSLQHWSELFQNTEMEFRSGIFQSTKEPQWERTTDNIKGKFDFFVEQTQSNPKCWMYFDYKYLNNISSNYLKNDVSWAAFGFPEVTAEESTIWIGSKGAHTPCHIDSYGYNLICQVFGRKLWVLFPPYENLKPSRVPYEESSIYSELNFFSPTIENFQDIKNAHIVILEPGDVLYVPQGWWHYVENLETAISINVWLPLPTDDLERIKEALVQFLVKQICNLSKMEIQKQILNPNMEEIIKDDSNNFLEMILKTTDIHQKNTNKTFKKHKTCSDNVSKRGHISVGIESDAILAVPKATHEEWMDFLYKQSNRFGSDDIKQENTPKEESDLIKLLKAFTDPDVIALITDKLLKNK